MLYLALFYSLLWFVLTGLEPKSLPFGIVGIAMALFFHRRLDLRPPVVNLRALFLFILVFLRQSFLSGLEVARLLLQPTPRVQPGFVVYNLSSEKKITKLLLAITLNLTPGTLTVEIGQKHLLLHLLQTQKYQEEEIRRLEELIDRVFP